MRTRVRWAILGALVALGAAAHGAAGISAPTRWIVFSALPKGLPPAQLFRVRTTGTGLEQITTGAKPATDPAFSPNGQRVVFVRLSAGIFVMNVDGSGLRRLTKAARDHFPVWSPDGRHIAFLRVYKNDWRVYVMDPSGSGLRRLRLAPPAGRPSWTVDSKSILTPSFSALDQIDARTGRVQKHIVLMKLDPATSQSATLSPNSRSIAFVGPRPSAPGCGDVSCERFALYLSGVPGGRTRHVANGTGPAGWSPDGRSLVFVYRGALYLWPVAGGKRTAIATGDNVAAGDAPPAWQPR